MRYFKTDDNLKIYYKDKGEGQPIILIHGWASNHKCYQVSYMKLSKNFRTIIYDLRGHGNSKCESSINIKCCAEDLKQLIEKLNVSSPILVGWSMGVLIILEYIKNYGCSDLNGIVLVDMGPKLINDSSWELGLFNGKFTKEDNDGIIIDIERYWKYSAEEFLRTIDSKISWLESVVLNHEIIENDKYRMSEMWRAMGEADYRLVLPQITVPALIIYGECSNLFPEETFLYMKNKIQDSEIIKFIGCTHMLVFENNDKFNRIVEEFALDIR